MSRLMVLSNCLETVEMCRAGEGPARLAEYVDGTPIGVLERALVLLQSGWRLVSAPLPPNVPLMRAPFRSLLLEESAEKFDIPGIEAVEKARKLLARQRAIGSASAQTESPIGDFAAVDRAMLKRAADDLQTLRSVLEAE